MRAVNCGAGGLGRSCLSRLHTLPERTNKAAKAPWGVQRCSLNLLPGCLGLHTFLGAEVTLDEVFFMLLFASAFTGLNELTWIAWIIMPLRLLAYISQALFPRWRQQTQTGLNRLFTLKSKGPILFVFTCGGEEIAIYPKLTFR